MVERLEYSSEPENYAGGDVISLTGLTKPDRSKERRQTKQPPWSSRLGVGGAGQLPHPRKIKASYENFDE